MREPQIYEMAGGYGFRLNVKYDPVTKKRSQKRFGPYKSKKEARDTRREKLAEISKGTFIEPSEESFQTFMTKWLKRRKKKIRQATYDAYLGQINNHIIPGLGNIPLGKLNAEHIEDFYDSLENLSESTVRKIHSIIKSALARAKTKRLITDNPAEFVETPAVKTKEMSYWTEEEAATFLSIAKENTRVYIMFHLALATGMRKGELLGLKWEDIDFENKVLYVRRQLTRQKELQEPKTKSSLRSISLDDHTITELKQHKKRQNKEKLEAGSHFNNQDGLVITTILGGRYHPDNVKRTWERIFRRQDTKAAGIKKIRFHDLRHTHATLLLKQGVHIKVVSERLGHASVRTTLDLYSHVVPGLQEAAAYNFGEALFGAKKENKESI